MRIGIRKQQIFSPSSIFQPSAVDRGTASKGCDARIREDWMQLLDRQRPKGIIAGSILR